MQPSVTGPWRDALRHSDIRRIELGWGLSLVASFTATVAMLVYAYSEGGARLVAAYGIASTVPAAVVTPLLMSLADRVRKDRLLRYTLAARTVMILLAGAAVAANAPAPLVITLAATSSSMAAIVRPVQAAVLPWLARTPAELTAATVTATVAENIGALVGPLLAGVALTLADPAGALAASAVCMGLAWLSLLRLAVQEDRHLPAPQVGPTDIVRRAAVGAAALVRIAPPAGMVVLAFAQTFVRGALLVLVIILALDTLVLDESSVGWLNAAIGLGGILGAVAAATVVRLTRLGRCFIVAFGIWGAAVLALAGAPTAAAAFAALLLVGIGNAIEDASAFILMPRLLGPQVAGRALGVFELVVLFGMGSGSLAAPVLVDLLGLRSTVATLGGMLLLLAGAYAWRFTLIDKTLPAPRPEAVTLRGLPMFAPLPMVVVEQLAAALRVQEYDAGEHVMREGDPGDRFHLITDGRAAVTVRGTPMPSLGPGDAFGEIALLHGGPRTATVTAADGLRTLALDRDAFLSAISRNPVSTDQAEALARRRLAADPQDGSP